MSKKFWEVVEFVTWVVIIYLIGVFIGHTLGHLLITIMWG